MASHKLVRVSPQPLQLLSHPLPALDGRVNLLLVACGRQTGRAGDMELHECSGSSRARALCHGRCRRLPLQQQDACHIYICWGHDAAPPQQSHVWLANWLAGCYASGIQSGCRPQVGKRLTALFCLLEPAQPLGLLFLQLVQRRCQLGLPGKRHMSPGLRTQLIQPIARCRVGGAAGGGWAAWSAGLAWDSMHANAGLACLGVCRAGHGGCRCAVATWTPAATTPAMPQTCKAREACLSPHAAPSSRSVLPSPKSGAPSFSQGGMAPDGGSAEAGLAGGSSFRSTLGASLASCGMKECTPSTSD